jgi:hypothetical protein
MEAGIVVFVVVFMEEGRVEGIAVGVRPFG